MNRKSPDTGRLLHVEQPSSLFGTVDTLSTGHDLQKASVVIILGPLSYPRLKFRTRNASEDKDLLNLIYPAERIQTEEELCKPSDAKFIRAGALGKEMRQISMAWGNHRKTYRHGSSSHIQDHICSRHRYRRCHVYEMVDIT